MTGLEPKPHYSAPKIRWWQEQGSIPSGWRVALVQDFIAGRLGLPPVTDRSLATRTMLLDREARSWSPELLDALSLEVAHLPQVVDAGAEIGPLSASGRQALGMRSRCAYVVGGLDAACVAMGVGAIEPGRRVLSLGTVASIIAVVDAKADDSIVPTGPHVVPGPRLAIGAAQAAGAALRWYRDLIAGVERDQEGALRVTIETLLQEIEDRPTGVMFVPHLSGSRFAFGDPALSATVVGLTLATHRPELTRAILEGVALELAMVCDQFAGAGIEIGTLTAAGGGTRSSMWVQIIADVAGRPIASTGTGDTGAVGAALLAGVGSGAFASFEEAAACAGRAVGGVIEPRAEQAGWWARRRADYRAIVAATARIPAVD